MKYLRKFDSVSDMNTVIANSTIGILGLAYNNGQPVMKIKSGGSPVPPTPPVTKATPFYIEDVSGSDNTLQIQKTHNNCPTLTIEKSLDGETWESMGTTSTTAITATVPANGKLYLRCSATRWAYEREVYESSYYECNKINCTGNFNAGGNIMSLLYGSNFTGNETEFNSSNTCIFATLFKGSKVVSAAELFLPATTMKGYCYYAMFQNCTSLTTAPTIPDATLTKAGNCYAFMFDGCSSLNYIKCLITGKSDIYTFTQYWVRGVAASGTFVKDPNMTYWATGVNGIPDGWTVQDAQD